MHCKDEGAFHFVSMNTLRISLVIIFSASLSKIIARIVIQEEGSESAGSTTASENENTWDSTGWSSSSQMPRSRSPFPQSIFYPWQAPSGYRKKIRQKNGKKAFRLGELNWEMIARTGTGEKGELCGLKQGRRGKKLSSNSVFCASATQLSSAESLV